MKTMREIVAIYSNIDAYISNGGRLLDLDMPPETHLHLLIENLDGPTIERLGRFYSAMGSRVGADQAVGTALTENDARRIWKETAER